MPVQPKQYLQTNRDADRLYSTDKTGVYDADTNTGGWGDPNAELDESALLYIAQRKGSTVSYLEVVGTQLFYNNASDNSYENVAEFIHSEDGHIRIYLLQFDASSNGTTLIKDGEVIEEDAYFYYDGDLCQKVNGEVVVVESTDYASLIGNTSIVQDYAENIFFPKLMMKLSALYQQKIDYREKNDVDNAEYFAGHARDLRDDIESAYNLFWSGLTIQANSLIESLTNKYSTF